MIATWLFERRGRVPPEYSAEYSKMLGSSIQGIHEYSAWILWILWILHWILRLNTLITPLNTPLFLFSWFFLIFFCSHFCGNYCCQLLKNSYFLTQLKTPPEYPEYSNRAFSLNTPGNPPSVRAIQTIRQPGCWSSKLHWAMHLVLFLDRPANFCNQYWSERPILKASEQHQTRATNIEIRNYLLSKSATREIPSTKITSLSR